MEPLHRRLPPMPDIDLPARLNTLAKSAHGRSKTARLRDVIEHVEAALRAGVSRSDVLAELNKDGFEMTLGGFKSALQRIREQTAAIRQNAVPAHQKENPTLTPAQHPVNKKNSDASVSNTSHIVLPDDWMTAKLTPAQNRLLTPTQRKTRTETQAAQFFPNRFKPNPEKT